MPQKVRAYIYRLLTPASALGVFYGVVTEQEAGLWVALGGAALLAGEGAMAAANTSTKEAKWPG